MRKLIVLLLACLLATHCLNVSHAAGEPPQGQDMDTSHSEGEQEDVVTDPSKSLLDAVEKDPEQGAHEQARLQEADDHCSGTQSCEWTSVWTARATAWLAVFALIANFIGIATVVVVSKTLSATKSTVTLSQQTLDQTQKTLEAAQSQADDARTQAEEAKKQTAEAARQSEIMLGGQAEALRAWIEVHNTPAGRGATAKRTKDRWRVSFRLLYNNLGGSAIRGLALSKMQSANVKIGTVLNNQTTWGESEFLAVGHLGSTGDQIIPPGESGSVSLHAEFEADDRVMHDVEDGNRELWIELVFVFGYYDAVSGLVGGKKNFCVIQHDVRFQTADRKNEVYAYVNHRIRDYVHADTKGAD
ncbi:MAG: hypothetical protein AAF394_17600 [Planctomycetota bacterium]